jgi:uncharacterized protein DUF5403
MGAVELMRPKPLNHVISKLEQVQRKVWGETQKIGRKATANLAAHRRTGDAKITVEFGKTDGLVSLEDAAAISIEYSHWVTTYGGKRVYVEGLAVLRRAAGMVS